MENGITDITLSFTYSKNHIARTMDTEADYLLIEDNTPKDTLLDLAIYHVFPEFRSLILNCGNADEGWDTDVVSHGSVVLYKEGERNKKGSILLYKDGSIAIAAEHSGEVVIRYIGNQYYMGYRLDNLHAVKPRVDNWFTALPANI